MGPKKPQSPRSGTKARAQVSHAHTPTRRQTAPREARAPKGANGEKGLWGQHEKKRLVCGPVEPRGGRMSNLLSGFKKDKHKPYRKILEKP